MFTNQEKRKKLPADFLNFFGTMAVSVVAAFFVLITTFDKILAILIFSFCFLISILARSFSKGVLTILILILIFPAFRFDSSQFISMDLLLFLLVLIGLIKFGEERSFPKGRSIPFSVKIFLILIISLIFSGLVFQVKLSELFWITVFSIFSIFFITLILGFFFQTTKRIESLIKIFVFGAFFQSFLIVFSNFFNRSLFVDSFIWHLHISPLTDGLNFQPVGLWGGDLALRLGVFSNPLVSFLLISIPLNLSLVLNNQEVKKELKIKFNKRRNNLINFKFGKSLFFLRKFFYGKINYFSNFFGDFFRECRFFRKLTSFLLFSLERLKRFKKVKRIKNYWGFWEISLLFQLVAMFLTFSYLGWQFLLLELVIMGILLRKKNLSFFSAILIIMFFIYPFLTKGREWVELYFNQSFQSLNFVLKNWFWGSGWKVIEKGIGLERISNGFLFAWNMFGLVGLMIVFLILVDFFKETRKTYLNLELGKERNFIVAFLAAFSGVVLDNFFSNSIFFGPSALVFWWMMSAAINLRKKKVVFGITETRIEI